MKARMVVTGVSYDKENNRTWIDVQTPQFSKRYYVSGYVTKAKALGFVRHRVERELREYNPAKRRTKKMTKLERLNAASRASKRRRVAKSLRAFVDAQLGKGKYAGAKVQKNPGGSITIIPVKLPRGGKRA